MSLGKIVGHQEQYHIEETIARGAFSYVYRCTDLSSGRHYAIKIINRALAQRNRMTEALIREVNAMEVVGSSPYVVGLVDKLISKHNYYIVMDLAEGGTLLDMIRERRRITTRDDWARPYFKQLLVGLATIHERNVAHRDIKPENILLNKTMTRVMISDFGFACYAPEGKFLHRGCGTLKFCAPELLQEYPEYEGRKVDIWAAGVTLYLMLFNTHPFSCKPMDVDSLLERMQAKPLLSYRCEVDDEVKEFLSKMLVIDPAERWSARELLEHPWMADATYQLTEDDDARHLPSCRCTSPVAETSFVSSSTLEDIDDGFYHHSHCIGMDSGESTEDMLSFPLLSAGTMKGCASSNDLSTSMSSQDSVGNEAHRWLFSVLYGCYLITKMIINFIVFSTVLLCMSALRLLFDLDVDQLPLPERLRRLIAYIIIPPAERDYVLRGRGAGASHGAQAGRTTPRLRHHERGSSPVHPRVPGFQIRRYVRVAARMISDASSVYCATPHDGKIETSPRGLPTPEVPTVGSSPQGRSLSNLRSGSRLEFNGEDSPQRLRSTNRYAEVNGDIDSVRSTRPKLRKVSVPSPLTDMAWRELEEASEGGTTDVRATNAFSPSLPLELRFPKLRKRKEDFPLPMEQVESSATGRFLTREQKGTSRSVDKTTTGTLDTDERHEHEERSTPQ